MKMCHTLLQNTSDNFIIHISHINGLWIDTDLYFKASADKKVSKLEKKVKKYENDISKMVRNKYSEICLNRNSFEQTFLFKINRVSVYTG